MSDKTIDLLWGVSLIVDGVCAVVVIVLNILDVELSKTLTPVLCVLLLAALAGIFVTTGQKMKRQKKK